MKQEADRAREVVPTGLRIPFDLRAALEREAEINGRTLSGEIMQRLRESLGHVQRAPAMQDAAGQPGGDGGALRGLSDGQRMLLALFDTLPPDKQLALMTLIRR